MVAPAGVVPWRKERSSTLSRAVCHVCSASRRIIHDARVSKVLDRSPLRGIPVAEQTIPALLERQAARYDDKPLVRMGTVQRSYHDTRDAAARAAGALQDAGIRRGDRLALMCENRIELLDMILGAMWMGAVAVPLNTALRGEQLAHQLRNSGARVLAIDTVLAAVLEHVGSVDALEQVWVIDGVPAAPPAGLCARVGGPPGPAAAIPAAPVGPGDTSAILYTSGTTGPSKGVLCPHAQCYWWGVLVGELLELGEDDVLYTMPAAVPHQRAQRVRRRRSSPAPPTSSGPRFSASRFWAQAAASGATVTYLLGAMVTILQSRRRGRRGHGAHRADRARTCDAGRGVRPLPRALRRPARRGLRLDRDELPPSATSRREQRPGWMGRVRAGFEARVVDDDDHEVAPARPASWSCAPQPPFAFATGYFAMPEKTVEAWRNLWFHTGDRVVRDEDGWFASSTA